MNKQKEQYAPKKRICPKCKRETEVRGNVYIYHDSHPNLRMLCKNSRQPVCPLPKGAN